MSLNVENYTTSVVVDNNSARIVVADEIIPYPNAENITIQDAGGYYTSDNVEGALQEVGSSLSNIDGQISSIDGRVTTAEGNITTLQSDVSALDGRLDTAESNITTLQSNFAGIAQPSGGGQIVYSSQFGTPRQTLSIALGLIAWNIANGQSAVVTLTGSATLSNPTNLPSYTMYPDLEVRQDAIGGHVLSFGSNFVLPANYTAAPTMANSITLYHFHLRSDNKLAVNYTHYTS